ncbi:MAG: tRNA pseudouridine(55) synthase TruB [Pirellulales bacterium]|nr:tRNA pseudouridine(55) synthase TruB [Pirellulales bacterium]
MLETSAIEQVAETQMTRVPAKNGMLKMGAAMFGVVNLCKPAAWTSRDAVNRVQRLVRPAKVGHAGTLDPIAEGVLVVCVGAATRLIEYVQRAPKEYRATFLLGQRSPSDDVETQAEAIDDAPQPTREELTAALPRFTGAIEQRPPAYSAVKIDGQRAYMLARRGEAVDIATRTVEVYGLQVERYDYPVLVLSIRCGGGTYVRSLGRDLAESLGTCAVMTQLVRTAVGDFRVEEAIDPRGVDAMRLRTALAPPLAAVGDLPRVELTAEQLDHVRRGGLIDEAALKGSGLASDWEVRLPSSHLVANESRRRLAGKPIELAAVDHAGNLVAILKQARPGLLRPSPNFLQMV